MKKYAYYIASCLIMTLHACSDEKENTGGSDDNKVTVSIATEVQTKAVVTADFKEGDEMNVYAKTYGKPDAPDLAESIKATYRNGNWSMTPEIKLAEGDKAFIYAIAPYMEGLKNLTAIPVDISKQQDILYSGSFVPVSYTTHQAKLVMKHALSLTTLNISNQGYTGKGNLQSISFSGDIVYTKGTMSIENGKITGTGKDNYTLESNKQIVASGWTENLPNMWIIPFSTKVSVAKLKAKIDGKEYEAKLPEVEMRSGFQYIFRLILTNYGLEFIPDQTITISLNQNTDQMGELKNYGVLQITHNNKAFTLPALSGDNVFGSVDWGDNSTDSYSIDATHVYSTEGNRPLIIESWNSTGFELKEITGVEVIDISQY